MELVVTNIPWELLSSLEVNVEVNSLPIVNLLDLVAKTTPWINAFSTQTTLLKYRS